VDVVYPTQEQFKRAENQQERPMDVAVRDLRDYLAWEAQQKEKNE
jgi:hypothetical protein